MFHLIGIVLFLISIGSMSLWSREMGKLTAYSKENGLRILGKEPEGNFFMYSDVSFMSRLWAYTKALDTEDINQHHLLVKVASLYRKAMYAWLVFIFYLMVMSFASV